MNEIKSRAWKIEIKKGDTKEQIETKNKIRQVLEMHKEKKPIEEIANETGFPEGAITTIIIRECTFYIGP